MRVGRWVFVCLALAAAANAFANCDNMSVVSPQHNTTVSPDGSGSVLLKWTAQVAAQNYDVYFGPVGSGCTTVHATTSLTEWSPPANEISAGTTYTWRVVATGPALTSCGPPAPQTACSTFTVASCPASAPSLQSPANNSSVTGGVITLQWSTVPNATSYEIFASFDGGPFFSSGTTTLSQKAVNVAGGHTIAWKVAALAGACASQISAPFSFTTLCPTDTPTLRSPNDEAFAHAGTPVAFDWTAVPGAQSYQLLVAHAGQNDVTSVETTNATTVSHTFPEGEWDWAIKTNFDNGCSSVSQSRTIVVGPACNNPAPDLLQPAEGAVLTSPVTLKWTDETAMLYRVYLQGPGDHLPKRIDDTIETSTSLHLDPGDYSWFVVAEFDQGCPELTSSTRTFTIEPDENACPANPGTATLVSPAQNASTLTSPVTFSWNAVPNASGYRVLAAFGNASSATLGSTKNTSLTVDVPTGSGYWIVQSLFGDNCPSTLSERRNLTVTTGAHCSDTAPQPIAPAADATNVSSPVEFRWGAVSDVIGYRLFVAPDGDDFSFYGETTETSLTRFVPAGRAKWYVTAQFAACPPAKSATVSFEVEDRTCAPASIVLKTPADGSTTSAQVHFSWTGTGVAGTESYRLWVAAAGVAPVVLARTTQTEATISLPAGQFTWYVDVPRTTCDSVVSPQGRFTVARSSNCGNNGAAALVAPVGTEQSPAPATNPVTLSWNGVANAIGYRVWLSRKGQPFADVALTHDTHASVSLDAGIYRWYVQTLFEGCDPTSSSVAFFQIAETSPRCPTGVATIVEPGANAVVSSPVTISWSAVSEAAKYRVFASRDGGEPLLLGATTDLSLERALPPGAYVISIETIFPNCPSTFSERRSFSVATSQNCTGAQAELVSPPNGSANPSQPVDFSWNPVSGAVKYVLFAQLGDGAPTPIDSTESTHISRVVPPGRVQWWVLTFFSGCDPTESAHFTFEVPRPSDCDNGKPILLLPSDDAAAVFSPVHFSWTGVPDATGYNVWLARGTEDFSIVATTTSAETSVALDPGVYKWFVQATFASCRPRESAIGEFGVRPPIACGRPSKPDAQVVGQAQSGSPYKVRWTPLPNVGLYELQESQNFDFTNATAFTESGNSRQFSHDVTGAPAQYLYRVRGVSNCSDERGPYSDVVGVFVIAPKTNNASAEIGLGDKVVQTIFLPGAGSPPPQFTATSDKPWITIAPSSGLLPPEGITLTVTASATALALGTNTATIQINYTAPASQGPRSDGTTVTTVPVSVSLVTPVTPAGSSAPPPDSLIFPVVGHAAGANDSLFESDIRVTNLTAQTMKYLLKFTPSGTDGTVTGSSSNIQIEPNQTLALDDIVSSMFGTGTVGSATGTLEIRPLTTSTASTGSIFSTLVPGALKQLATAASSRTYNFTPNGTFGQFIPAVRFDEFVGKAASGSPAAILSLQQVAQSSAYRANFGFAEGSGQPADLLVRVYDTTGALLKSIPVSLQAGEHKQINGMLSLNGIDNLANGRVEVEVVGGNGKVTAYVSEVDNRTNDPLLVTSVLKGATSASRYVVPGVAYINSGAAFWVTDLRIFNSGPATSATLTFYPQGNPSASVTREVQLDSGEIEVIDNVLGGLFGQPNGAGGSIAITTPSSAPLNATARTYNQTANGTYGQYIPGVTTAQSVGASDRALQILQLEQSSRIRTNVGLDETSGQSARVEVTLTIPDSIASPVITFDLQPNEFRQFSLADFNLGPAAIYNARVTVKVVSGNGRVTAYGSAIDQVTQDPTYVPAQ
jgi:hypothetical protein